MWAIKGALIGIWLFVVGVPSYIFIRLILSRPGTAFELSPVHPLFLTAFLAAIATGLWMMKPRTTPIGGFVSTLKGVLLATLLYITGVAATLLFITGTLAYIRDLRHLGLSIIFLASIVLWVARARTKRTTA
ncbi:MAG TPA: hypothetical protein VHM93_22630 [Candidatus Acidoferrum sp.]|jgi:uncharacterized membrane protein YoaK (UPF0700 family)|nr:hypothetical protein [Candidatus Acidoferrum sp.]